MLTEEREHKPGLANIKFCPCRECALFTSVTIIILVLCDRVSVSGVYTHCRHFDCFSKVSRVSKKATDMLTTKTYICLQLLHTLLHQLKTRGCSVYCSVLSTISNSKYPDTTLFLFLVFLNWIGIWGLYEYKNLIVQYKLIEPKATHLLQKSKQISNVRN